MLLLVVCIELPQILLLHSCPLHLLFQLDSRVLTVTSHCSVGYEAVLEHKSRTTDATNVVSLFLVLPLQKEAL